MKGGGGLTWAGWLMVGVGSMLIYAGMTGQSLVGEFAAVLNGRKLSGAAAPDSTPPVPAPGSSGGSVESRTQAPPHPATIPNPTYGRLP